MNQQKSTDLPIRGTPTDHIDFVPTGSTGTQSGPVSPTVERLRASRAEFLRKLGEDARKAGAVWVKDHASYEQVKYVLWLKASDTTPETLGRLEPGNPLESVAARLDRFSSAPAWSRNWRWHAAFFDGILTEWNKIAKDVEFDSE